MEPRANTLAAFSFLAFVLVIPALIWHCRSRNVPAIFLLSWLTYNNLVSFINSLIWSNEDFSTKWDGQGYCDVVLKLEAGSSCGKVCALSALALNLLMVLRAKNPSYLGGKSTKKLVIELSICLITPVFVMATNYIIQSPRYVITRYRGCQSSYSVTTASLLLYSIWNLLWSIVASTLAALTLVVYLQKRKDVKDILKCTNSGLTLRRFARLLIFSLVLVVALTPTAIYYFATDARAFHGKFIWDEVHSAYWNMITFYDVGFSIVFERFVDIGISIIAFFLFGLGTDAIKMYKKALSIVGFKFSPTSKDSREPLSKGFSNLTDQTRIGSNRSAFISKHETTPSTMGEFNREFSEIMNDVERMNTYSTTTKSPSDGVTVYDLEKGSTHGTTNSEETVGFKDEGIDYNFQIKSNNL